MQNPLEVEVWKDIPNFEGYYQISSFGRVKSLERMVRHSAGGLKIVKEKILKLCLYDYAYVGIHIKKENKSYQLSIHQVVAIVFLGHKKSGHDLIVDHKDGNQHNNRLDNLQIITQRENVLRGALCSGKRLTGARLCRKTGRWYGIIQIKGKRKLLGRYDTEMEAHQSYLKALSELK